MIDYTKTLLHKGTLLALETKLRSNVAALNTSLSSDTITAFSISSVIGQPGPMLASHIQIGDLTSSWTLDVAGVPKAGGISGGAFRIRVCMPMNAPGFTAQKRTQGNGSRAGVTTTINSDIYVYAHGDLWRDDNKDFEARNVCLVMATMEDWVRTTINSAGGTKLILPSFESGTAINSVNTTGGDELNECLITTGSDGYYPVFTGGDTFLHALHLIHSGVVAV